MPEEDSVKSLEKRLRQAWEKKLKTEGFEPGGSVGADGDWDAGKFDYQPIVDMVAESMKKHNPIEVRVIHEAVFDRKYINIPTYRVYYRK